MALQTRALSNDEAFDRWQTDLLKEAINHRHSAWSIGDLLLEGERKFDDARYIQTLEATRLTIEALTNYKSLAKCFPVGKRRLNLGVSHHEAIRSLDEGARDAMLDLVEKHEISRENLRDRVKAYKGGDAGALAIRWKQPNKVIEVEDSHAGVIDDDDKPVFDSTSAGEGIAGERASKERPDFEATDANQTLIKGLDILDKAIGAANRAHLILERVSVARLRAAAAELTRLADEADHVQSGRWSKKTHPAPKADRIATQAGADRASKEAATGGDVDPTTASSPQHFNSALASPPGEPDSGEDRATPPVRTSPDFIPETTSTPAPNTAVLTAQENAGPVPGFLRRVAQ